ncbi:MAG TPA: ATP-binding protein [Gemmatimonadales bacterium]|nr:ATP-binding protein [Gemmatimonadales bacterium]
MKLSRKLFASYVLLVAASTVTLTVATDRSLRSRLLHEATLEVTRETAILVHAVAGRHGAALDALVYRLGRETGRRVTVIDTTGLVIADSDFPHDQLASLENHATRPEFRAALHGATGTDLRRSVSTGRWELKVAMPIAGGAARVSTPLPQVDVVVADAQGAVLLGGLLALVVGAVLASGFARSVARPLVRLREAAQAFAHGKASVIDTRGRDEVGDLARALRTVQENLTQRMADLERERAEMTALFSSMVEGVIALDATGAVTALNPAARELLKLSPEGPLPAALELFRQRPAHDLVEKSLAGGASAGQEIELDDRTVLLSAHPLPTRGAVLVLHDITGLKRLENVRRDFVANVSHELKTPLTVIRGYAETLLAEETPPDIRRSFVEKVLANAHRMQQLVDDLLDLSRIESGAWTPRLGCLPLAPLIQEVWTTLKPRADAQRLTFQSEIAPDAAAVTADGPGARQILLNVLDNCVRYTPAGGRVTVRSSRSAEGVTVEISDTGVGIPSEHLPRIFERFYRVDAARSREVGGTGLGLAIVKHLVEAHGGRVTAESALSAGTTIRILFPEPPAG